MSALPKLDLFIKILVAGGVGYLKMCIYLFRYTKSESDFYIRNISNWHVFYTPYTHFNLCVCKGNSKHLLGIRKQNLNDANTILFLKKILQINTFLYDFYECQLTF